MFGLLSVFVNKALLTTATIISSIFCRVEFHQPYGSQSLKCLLIGLLKEKFVNPVLRNPEIAGTKKVAVTAKLSKNGR